MKKSNKLQPVLIAVLVVAGLAGFAWSLRSDIVPGNAGGASGPLSQVAMAGKTAYDANCTSCHGANGAGSDKGPSFIHAVCNPGHHPDAAFARAAQQGVRQHHWRFGDMPAQLQVSAQQLETIVRYVRELQEFNGIRYEQHTM